jgi:hypothetical protein
MRNTNSNSNALFLIVISLFIVIFIIVSYVIFSGSIFDTDVENSNSSNSSNLLNSKNSYNTSSGKEVFNIRDNNYTYEEAKAICAAHNSRLATLEELIRAYKKGANWCSYGWSEGQMALYPTQKDFWEKLQGEPYRKNECGEVGINGGYFENNTYKFGVNCYGNKPSPKSNEIKQSKYIRSMTPHDELTAKYKMDVNTIRVSPFNSDKDQWYSK